MSHILLDLDGTLHDPGRGIIGSIRIALSRLDLPAPPPEDLGWTIGPPLRQSFPRLGVPADRIDFALAAYREHYRDGAMFDADVYAGIPEALDSLADLGHRLIVATSKPHVFARPILEHFGLADRFLAIHGAELDGRNDDKGELIADIVRRHGLRMPDAIMVGDRHFDVRGAAKNGIACLGVLWGYGAAAELTGAGAVALVSNPHDLPGSVSRALAGLGAPRRPA